MLFNSDGIIFILLVSVEIEAIINNLRTKKRTANA